MFESFVYLHGGDDHSSVHDELTQRCRALVAVPAVDHQQATDVLKLSDGEISGQRRLLPFLLTHRSKDAVRLLVTWHDNLNIIGSEKKMKENLNIDSKGGNSVCSLCFKESIQ